MNTNSSSSQAEEYNTSFDQDDTCITQAKVILIGEPSVGKTSVILQYVQKEFKYNNLTTCG